MKRSVLALAALLCVAVSAPLSANAALTVSDDVSIKIVGGETVKRDSDNPGAVHLVARGYDMACTASLIGKRWVLTARHCVDGENIPQPSGVRSGSITAGRGKYSAVKAVHQSPGGDTALLELATDGAGPILRYASNDVPLNVKVRAYGWGSTGGGDTSSVLKTAELQTVNYADNPFYADGRDVVVRGITGVPYFGDSGGPLIYKGVVVGTVSGGDHNGDDINAQEFYALTSANASWIKQVSGIAGTSVR